MHTENLMEYEDRLVELFKLRSRCQLNRDCPLERKLVIPAKWGKQVGHKVTTRKAGIQLIKECPRSGSIPLFCRLRRVFYLAGFPPQPALEWGCRGRERRANGQSGLMILKPIGRMGLEACFGI